ncbi:hypothetical protein VE04_05540 [Pseudogymnoascus sp. 24MN13]|nr:hypothetical protein VE04_05540 [Pseudogymnoascus sp. 24MN13]
MDSADQGMQFFGREYKKVLALYNDDDKEEECIAAAQDLLENPDLPRYHRIMTLIVLSAASTNWNDAEDSRLEAERLWDQTHRHYSRVDNPDASRALAELRVDLDAVKELQIEELEKLDRMFGEYDGEYDEEEDEREDEEEDEREEGPKADVEIAVDVDADADAADDGAATVVSYALSDAENQRLFDDTEENAPNAAAYDHATMEGELPTDKSGESTDDKKASGKTQLRNKLTGNLRFKAGKKGGLAHRPSLVALRSRVESGQQ